MIHVKYDLSQTANKLSLAQFFTCLFRHLSATSWHVGGEYIELNMNKQQNTREST